MPWVIDDVSAKGAEVGRAQWCSSGRLRLSDPAAKRGDLEYHAGRDIRYRTRALLCM